MLKLVLEACEPRIENTLDVIEELEMRDLSVSMLVIVVDEGLDTMEVTVVHTLRFVLRLYKTPMQCCPVVELGTSKASEAVEAV